MAAQSTTNHDLFLSYSRKDEEAAKALNAELQARGVRTFMDQKDIDPGALFESDIFSRLAASNSYALVLTRNSLASTWVNREYEFARKLLNERKIRIIPLLFDTVNLPATLAVHNIIDFRAAGTRAANLRRLIFPGITGKHLTVRLVNRKPHAKWQLLEDRLARYHGILDLETEDMVRDWMASHFRLSGTENKRVVAIFDLFGAVGWDYDYSLRQSLQLLFHLRHETRGTKNEVIFVLFHDQHEWNLNMEKITTFVGDKNRERLQHYFHIDMAAPENELIERIDTTLIKVLQELMRAEHSLLS